MGDYNDGILPDPCLRLDYGFGDDWKSIELGDGTGYYRADYFVGMFRTALNLAKLLVGQGVDLAALVASENWQDSSGYLQASHEQMAEYERMLAEAMTNQAVKR